MAHIVQLDEKTFVTGQIDLRDVAEIAASGVTYIINNRPDGEELSGQPLASDIEAAADRNGLSFANLPFTAPTLTSDLVAEFAEILKSADGPVLAYCRTGNRCTMIWAAANIALGNELDSTIERAAQAGYDLRPAAQFLYDLGRAATVK